jgi:hypothetical protein
MTIVPANVDEILAWWQAAHFKLSPEQQERFKKDPQIPNLLTLHFEAVKEVILLNKLQKIKDIYSVASALQIAKLPSANHSTTVVVPTPAVGLVPRFKKNFTRSTTTTRGRDSFKEHSMINPPPVESLVVDRSKLPKCTICNQPIVGTMCGCW